MSASDRLKALQIVQEHNIKAARGDFSVFVRMFAPLILPDPFEEGEHIWLLCRELQLIEKATRAGVKKRLQISISPRSGKTVTLNMFIAWCLGRNPRWKVMHISHTQSLVEDISGGPIKDIINFPEYRAVFPDVYLRKDSRAKNRWSLTAGGIYTCFGTNQNLAGRGANIVVVDDAMSEQTAISKAEREKVNNLYAKGVRSRIWKLGSEICVGTRWRLDDLLGFQQKLDGTEENPLPGSNYPWRVISIPAILDAKASKLLNLPEGGSYWPETKSMEEILELKRSNTPADWLSLYMQAPTMEEGNIFKNHHFKWMDPGKPPDNIKFVFVAMDTAFSTRETADLSAICVYGLFDQRHVLANGREKNLTHAVLLDFKQGRWDFPSLCEEAQNLYDQFEPDTFIVENKASGQSLIQELMRRGVPVQGYQPDRDKISRAHACTPIHLAGRVHFPRLKFGLELAEELKSFPNAAHDDATDAHAMAINWLKDTFEVTHDQYMSEREAEDDEKPRRRYAASYFQAAAGMASGNF